MKRHVEAVLRATKDGPFWVFYSPLIDGPEGTNAKLVWATDELDAYKKGMDLLKEQEDE